MLLIAGASPTPPTDAGPLQRGSDSDDDRDGARRLLLVDDELELRQLLAMVLADAGWGVVEAEDGERALEVLERERFDLVLLDHRMPGLTGSEVYQRLRAAGDDTPVILMTAARNVRELARGLGVPHFLGKPFDVDDLFATIGDVARASDPARRPADSPEPSDDS